MQTTFVAIGALRVNVHPPSDTRGIKLLMLNTLEHEANPTHKC